MKEILAICLIIFIICIILLAWSVDRQEMEIMKPYGVPVKKKK